MRGFGGQTLASVLTTSRGIGSAEGTWKMEERKSKTEGKKSLGSDHAEVPTYRGGIGCTEGVDRSSAVRHSWG